MLSGCCAFTVPYARHQCNPMEGAWGDSCALIQDAFEGYVFQRCVGSERTRTLTSLSRDEDAKADELVSSSVTFGLCIALVCSGLLQTTWADENMQW